MGREASRLVKIKRQEVSSDFNNMQHETKTLAKMSDGIGEWRFKEKEWEGN
jgi:hypothetical protein